MVRTVPHGGPVVEELANDYDGKAVVGKVNVDHNSDVSQRFGIRNIPTILLLEKRRSRRQERGGSAQERLG